MKFYSDNLKKLFDSAEECEKAEQEALEAQKKAELEKEKLAAERKARADEVEVARKAMVEAQKNYEKVMRDFLRDYHTYHYSTSNLDDMPKFFPFFDNWF